MKVLMKSDNIFREQFPTIFTRNLYIGVFRPGRETKKRRHFCHRGFIESSIINTHITLSQRKKEGREIQQEEMKL